MNKKHVLLAFMAATLPVVLPSCLDDDDDSYVRFRPTAVVTVCPDEDGGFLMHLDDDTRLIPTNMKKAPYGGKEVRALVNYTETSAPERGIEMKYVEVNWLDSIRTKLPVETLGDRNDEVYGNDEIEIVNDWVTVAEDGYLTLRIRALWGETQTTHYINLLTGVNPEDPFELELRHDAKGDTYGRWGDALIAFNLNNLPRPEGDKTKIKLKWKSFNGEKTAEIDIRLRPRN